MSKKIGENEFRRTLAIVSDFLVKHNKEWVRWYDEERKVVLSMLPDEYIKRISHIGSTAVLGIWAKNIVDLLIEVNNPSNLEMVKDILIHSGWHCMNAKTDFIKKHTDLAKRKYGDRYSINSNIRRNEYEERNDRQDQEVYTRPGLGSVPYTGEPCEIHFD